MALEKTAPWRISQTIAYPCNYTSTNDYTSQQKIVLKITENLSCNELFRRYFRINIEFQAGFYINFNYLKNKTNEIDIMYI